MVTRWKKWKLIVSFAAFFVGMTLLLVNFFNMLNLLARTDFQAGRDYQKTEEFADYISERLETLVSAAVGGEDWNGEMEGYGTAYENVYVYEDTLYSGNFETSNLFGGGGNQTEAGGELGIAVEIPGETEQEKGQSYRDAYMEELTADKNLLFAVMYQGKLLYTNLDGLSEQMEKESGVPDFSSFVSAKDYNFSLCYNKNGDGKTEIVKDGRTVDVYGDGIYDSDSRWYVPGYQNFEVEGEAEDVVVFLAAAKEPRLYLGDYGQGSVQRGGALYSMQRSLLYHERMLCTELICVGAALLLLLAAFRMRRELHESRQWMGRQLGKVWIEIKAVVFWGIPVFALLFCLLTGMLWGLFQQQTGIAVYFWLLYFGFLDRRYNKGSQKSMLKPVRDSLRTRDLSRPVQKRLVRRQWLFFVPVLGILLLLLFILLILWDIMYWNGVFVLFLAALCGILFLAAGILIYMKKNRRLAEDIGALADRIEAVCAGSLTGELKLPEDSDLRKAAENLDTVSQGLERALDERTKSERMKVELIANVSHDLKTPLTSVVSYIELLKQEEELPEHVRDYIRILDEKAERLGNMVQDVFEVSKAASGQLPVHMERLDLAKLLRQTLADMDGQIEKSGLVLRAEIPKEAVMIQADGQRLYRVFQNLLQNALQYSLKGSRIYLTLITDQGKARASVKNTSATELEADTDFTERFVRGDKSRTDGGSGLGLSIAKSFTQACGGELLIRTDADLFVVTVVFPFEDTPELSQNES